MYMDSIKIVWWTLKLFINGQRGQAILDRNIFLTVVALE